MVLAAPDADGAEYYVAPTGSDSNPGTMAAPFATLQRGHTAAAAGDTVYVRGGTYAIVGHWASSGAGIAITKSGTSATNRIKFFAYNGEVPVFDFAWLSVSTSDYTSGFSVTGSWLHFKGLEIKNVPMNTRNCALGATSGRPTAGMTVATLGALALLLTRRRSTRRRR